MRKRFFKGLVLAIALLFTTSLASCDKEEATTIEDVVLIPGSVPGNIKTEEVATKVTQIKLRVYKTDGTTEEVNVTLEMIGAEVISELEALTEDVTKVITIKYEGWELKVNLVMDAPEPVVDKVTITIPNSILTLEGVFSTPIPTGDNKLCVYSWTGVAGEDGFSDATINEETNMIEAEIRPNATGAILVYLNEGATEGSWDNKAVQSADLVVARGADKSYTAYLPTTVTSDLTTLEANLKVLTALPTEEYDLYIWTWGGSQSAFVPVDEEGNFKAPVGSNGGCYLLMPKGDVPNWNTKFDQTNDYVIAEGVCTPKAE